MRHALLGTTLAIGLAILPFDPASAQQTKTAGQCNADYAANKPAIQAAKIKKKDFVASCRAGNEVIPSGAPAAAAPAPVAPAPAPAQTSAPAPAPSQFNLNPFARKKAASAAPAPTTAGAPAGANQFAAEAQAQARCPGATVVWLNTKSGVYHFAATKNYGNTKAGAYMCETDATAAGDRASKTEKHP